MSNEIECSSGLLFATRCKSIPVFNSTCFWLNEYYKRIKDINTVTKCTMSVAETTFKTSICLANPIIEKFKDRLQTLDTMACRQLDKLEAAFPILHEDTVKVVNEGKIFLTKTCQPAFDKIITIEDKYLAIKKYGLTKVSLLKNNEQNKQAKAKRLIKILLDASEYVIQTYLIDGKSCLENDEKLKKFYQPNDACLSNRAKLLTLTVYWSIQKRCLKQVNTIMQPLDVYLNKLNQLFSLLERKNFYLKKQFNEKLNFTLQKMNLYKDYIELLAKQMMVQDGRSLDHVHSIEERSKILLRRSLGNLFTALYLVYKRFNVSKMHQNLNEKYLKIVEKIVNYYRYFLKPNHNFNLKSIKDFRTIIHSIQLSLYYFFKNISKTRLATWLIPNFDVFGVIDDLEEECVRPNKNICLNVYSPKSSSSSLNEPNINNSSSKTFESSSPSSSISESSDNLQKNESDESHDDGKLKINDDENQNLEFSEEIISN